MLKEVPVAYPPGGAAATKMLRPARTLASRNCAAVVVTRPSSNRFFRCAALSTNLRMLTAEISRG